MVTLESGEKVAYDDLIIATGTGGPFPAKLPLDVNKEKAIQRYEEYVKLVSVANAVNAIVHVERFSIECRKRSGIGLWFCFTTLYDWFTRHLH